MFSYVMKRIMAGVLSIFVLATVTFFMMHAIPGGPFSPSDEKDTPPVILEKLNEKYGLNDPVYIQYGRYMKNLAKGDLGISFKHTDTTVNELIERGFPATAKVGAVALVTSFVVGIILGIISAVKENKFFDWFTRVFATVGISIPNFVLCVLLLFLFSVKLDLLPSLGLTTWKHYVLPVIGLSVSPTAYIARLTRSSMLGALQQDYIRTARSKGVKEIFVVLKHGLRNAIIPTVTYLGTLTAALLTGGFVVERLYSIPGIGREFVSGINDRDYSVVIGLTIFYGAILVVANIIIDILYAVIDPRVKLD